MIKVARGCLGEEELAAVKEAFAYGYFGLAYKVNEFENALKEYLGTSAEVVATNTGTSALHLALSALGVGTGDEVIVPSFTFVASVQAVEMCGATPILCEVDQDTFLMDIEDVKRKISPRTKVIMPVHYSGNPCDMDELLKIKENTGIRIVEDAAHAIGSTYKGRKIGAFGDITCFSFDSIKVITCGEGGCIVTSDEKILEQSRMKRLLGIDRKTMHTKNWKERSWIYDVNTIGYRYHMSNINAAIGCEQLKKIDLFIIRRRQLCKLYATRLKDVKGIKLMKMDYDVVAPFMFPIRVLEGRRDELKKRLQECDIETGISYIPNHLFSLFRMDKGAMAISDKIFEEILCLPLHFELSDDDVYEVCDGIMGFLQG
ncbi:MAG: DegT/DnrJ/EryC1/StrS family aminotransferase [Ruminococcus sp.]|nr:DegT/DnrJ/EryC1/StrS family aminotransferase [Ruminococcus sp.]